MSHTNTSEFEAQLKTLDDLLSIHDQLQPSEREASAEIVDIHVNFMEGHMAQDISHDDKIKILKHIVSARTTMKSLELETFTMDTIVHEWLMAVRKEARMAQEISWKETVL